jgi:hypothetical protein
MKIEMNSSSTIIPKPCSYNCDTRIYWNNQEMHILKYLQNKNTFAKIELLLYMNEFINA